jgi:hypothetical protein
MPTIIPDAKNYSPIWGLNPVIGSHVAFRFDDGSIITVRFGVFQQLQLGENLEPMARKAAQQYMDKLAPEIPVEAGVIDLEGNIVAEPTKIEQRV